MWLFKKRLFARRGETEKSFKIIECLRGKIDKDFLIFIIYIPEIMITFKSQNFSTYKVHQNQLLYIFKKKFPKCFYR